MKKKCDAFRPVLFATTVGYMLGATMVWYFPEGGTWAKLISVFGIGIIAFGMNWVHEQDNKS